MPYPRFDKLPREKRERLLDMAAQEFAAHGFAHASINRILERAGMSKGAAYYYFQDKLDLFAAVVGYCIERLRLIDTDLDLAALNVETLWPTFADLRRGPLLRTFEQPWLFAALRAAGRLPPEILAREPMAGVAQRFMAWVMAVVKRGREVGAIRDDLPDALLFAWLDALDDASDRYFLTRRAQLDRVAVARLSDQTVDAMRRVMAPTREAPTEEALE
jgi:AcrR family transcriptional regulator